MSYIVGIRVAHSDESGGVPAVPDVGHELSGEHRGAGRLAGHGTTARALLYVNCRVYTVLYS